MKREVSKGSRLSTQSCKHSLPGSCVKGCVVQLSEAQVCVDEGRAVRILRDMCRAVDCQSKEGSPG